jgi:hypothetical protein
MYNLREYESEHDSESDLDEFGTEFLQKNPGIVKSQDFTSKNFSKFGFNRPVVLNVNLSQNNVVHCKNQGLNSNKRGSLKPKDLTSMKDSIKHQIIEDQRNAQFLVQKEP